jgi:two-component system phosphate regulon sensor histidine kinase PhoR
VKIRKIRKLDILDNAQFEIFVKDLASSNANTKRVYLTVHRKLIKKGARKFTGVKTKFEFAIYNNELLPK